MNDDRPAWARRMTREREARGWSQADVITAMRMHARPKPLPDDASMLRQWKRWESGEHMPGEFYQPIIAAAFGTVTHAIFPATGRHEGSADILAASGMDTLELVSRMQSSDVDGATIDALRLTTDQLCSDYPFLPSDTLLIEGEELAAEAERLARPASDSRPAPRDPGPGRMAGLADWLRGVRLRAPPRGRDHPPGSAVDGEGDRQRGDQRMGA